MSSLRVLLFASYADAFGAPFVDVDIAPGARVRDVLDSVLSRSGDRPLPRAPMIAVNAEYAHLDDAVNAGDEVAIIPPVAGG